MALPPPFAVGLRWKGVGAAVAMGGSGAAEGAGDDGGVAALPSVLLAPTGEEAGAETGAAVLLLLLLPPSNEKADGALTAIGGIGAAAPALLLGVAAKEKVEGALAASGGIGAADDPLAGFCSFSSCGLAPPRS